MTAFVVVNPSSGNGRTGRDWSAIERALHTIYPAMSVGFTHKQGDATEIVRHALHDGHEEIVAVGGDGTINEAVNGMFDASGTAPQHSVFAFVTSGTGGDFRKTFGIDTGVDAAIEKLKHAKIRPIDVGRVNCLSKSGKPTTRYFVNIASFGLSGVIVDAVNGARIAKLFGGSFAFAFHSALAMLRYRNRKVRIMIDGNLDEIASISTVVVANGQYFGGGMKVAPGAVVDDAMFDVVIMGGAPKGRSLTDMKLIYTGEHIHKPYVSVQHGQHVVAAPVAETHSRAVFVETDGEAAGRLPATFEILPQALNLRC